MAEHDLTLIVKAQQGDRNAFERLLGEHYTMIYRVAYRFCGHKQDAEDLAQDVCVQLAHKLQGFKAESSFSTWLYKVVLNSCRDRFRSQRTKRGHDQTYLELEKLEVADSQDSQRKAAWLYRELALLDAALKETALLVLAEELSHAEAGKILGCAESTVSWRMHEVRKLLKQRLDTYP